MKRNSRLLISCLLALTVFWMMGLPAGSAGSAGIAMPQRPAFTCDGVSEIPRAECEALVALYDSTNGPGWASHDGWLATNTPCSWYGVTCQAGHVQRLQLVLNQLSGVIPPQLGDLAKLESFNLSFNPLSGAIPPELGNLANLLELKLHNNSLSGTIPPELSNLANLYRLDLGGNQLNGAIPHQLGILANLQDLVLSNNQFSGALPHSLTKIRLRWFFFNNTNLCEPPDAAFQAWLAGIPELGRTGIRCSYAYLPVCWH